MIAGSRHTPKIGGSQDENVCSDDLDVTTRCLVRYYKLVVRTVKVLYESQIQWKRAETCTEVWFPRAQSGIVQAGKPMFSPWMLTTVLRVLLLWMLLFEQ